MVGDCTAMSLLLCSRRWTSRCWAGSVKSSPPTWLWSRVALMKGSCVVTSNQGVMKKSCVRLPWGHSAFVQMWYLSSNPGLSYTARAPVSGFVPWCPWPCLGFPAWPQTYLIMENSSGECGAVADPSSCHWTCSACSGIEGLSCLLLRSLSVLLCPCTPVCLLGQSSCCNSQWHPPGAISS